LLRRRSLRPPLFPYTTLFRSLGADLPVRRLRRIRHDLWRGSRRALCRRLGGAYPQRRILGGDGQAISTLWLASHSRLRVKLRRADRKSTRLNSSHVAISYAVF